MNEQQARAAGHTCYMGFSDWMAIQPGRLHPFMSDLGYLKAVGRIRCRWCTRENPADGWTCAGCGAPVQVAVGGAKR